MDGGSNLEYSEYPGLWGKEPGSYVKKMTELVPTIAGWNVLDAGCGEGRNATFLARRGAQVIAVDTSAAALRNAQAAYGSLGGITWRRTDAANLRFSEGSLDAIISYGFLHCLSSESHVVAVVRNFRVWLKNGGYLVIAAFNDRSQDVLDAHPTFSRLLLSHETYMRLVGADDVICSSDEDLRETHPDKNILHVHSMTRLLVRKSGSKELHAG